MTARCYYGVRAAGVLGAEVEGQPGSVAVGTGTFYALNLGSAVPPAGTVVVATFIASRWIFVY